METTRLSLDIPKAWLPELQRLAGQRQMTIEALAAALIKRAIGPLSYEGIVEDDPDLSLKIEEILSSLDL